MSAQPQQLVACNTPAYLYIRIRRIRPDPASGTDPRTMCARGGEEGRLGSVGEKTRTAIGPRAPISHFENGGADQEPRTKKKKPLNPFFLLGLVSKLLE